MDAVCARQPAVYVLDVDPDLGRGIAVEQRSEARQRSIARMVTLEKTLWNPGEIFDAPRDEWLGLLVLEGLLLRRVTVASRASCELLGSGDVIRPWDEDGDHEPLTVSVDWLVIQPARVAVLDSAFARRIAPWPSISGELVRRIAARARNLSLAAAVTHLPRTHSRLLLLFWLFTDRWGRVTPEGIAVRLPLTHQVLAMLVGSHRPSVTLGLQKLARDGLLIRQAQDRWLLTPKAMEALQRPV